MSLIAKGALIVQITWKLFLQIYIQKQSLRIENKSEIETKNSPHN